MLSPSEEAFIARMDVPSMHQSQEAVARSQGRTVADEQASFTNVPPAYRNTRIALGHDAAIAGDLWDIAELLRMLRTEPADTLRRLGAALLADESSGRPSDNVVPLRSVAAARSTSSNPHLAPGKDRA